MRYKFITIICLVFALASCKEESTNKVLYLAHNLPQTHPVHKGILEFQKVLENNSGGALKARVFPDGQLGSEREVLELLQIGSVAATKVSAATLSNFVPEYHLLGIPYLFRDKQHLFDVLEGPLVNPYWKKEVSSGSAGFVIMTPEAEVSIQARKPSERRKT